MRFSLVALVMTLTLLCQARGKHFLVETEDKQDGGYDDSDGYDDLDGDDELYEDDDLDVGDEQYGDWWARLLIMTLTLILPSSTPTSTSTTT